MNRVIGVVNLGNPTATLGPLTQTRSIGSVPFGGRYRLIDFTLSNMVNSGLQKIAVFTLQQSRSLIDHLGSGKEWDLDRRHGGLFVLPPVIDLNGGEFKGDLQNLFGHIDYFNRSKESYVIISNSQFLYNFDYSRCMEFHVSQQADMTMLYHVVQRDRIKQGNYTVLEIDQNSRVLGMKQAGLEQDWACEASSSNLFLESFIISKQKLVQLIEEAISQGRYDLKKDVLSRSVSQLKTVAYRHTGHLSIIDSISNYYQESMQLLQPAIYQSLFFQPGRIYTKIKDEPPTKYCDTSHVQSALIANGCNISGNVENSILFRGVKVGKGARIKNSIIMQKCSIEPGAYIENAILDKEVYVCDERVVIGERNEPIVIPKRTSLQENTNRAYERDVLSTFQ